jgi:competence protein ComEA
LTELRRFAYKLPQYHRPEAEVTALAEQLEKYRWLIFALMSLPLIGSVALLARDEFDEGPAPVVREADTPYYDIRVYVAGAVAKPGIYALEEGTRWGDAITVAGGFTADANPEAINLARRVKDEDHIVVPRTGAVAVDQGDPNRLLNINSATESELTSLPGIGETRAANIVRSRTEDGPFGVTEDLLARRLLPASVYEEIAGMITVAQ